ncbi:hypothetical protein [Flammeovirga sp. SJP92]|uniref:hypothetical protein n=1 Tax=Flammeovirga sp. SJP92 TaxID=1775430 RepID=UPI000786A4ED|nr:hypothetical protein [Flammeovirga sp. SJP92]KXX67589.1 hypothetical protein AVL50_26375 [Flammeovirga sp. SJP92]
MQPNDKIKKWKRQHKLILTGMILFTFTIILLQLSYTSVLKGPYGILITIIALIGGYALVIYPLHKLKWFLWAFKDEKNKKELLKLAVEAKIILQYNTDFLYANSKEKELIKKYYDQAKESNQSSVESNPIFKETIFYNDKGKLIEKSTLAFTIPAVLFIIFLYLGISKEFKDFSDNFKNLIPIVAILAIFFFIKVLWNVFDSSIKLRINEQGIQIRKNRFHLWKDVKRIEIEETRIKTGNSSKYVPMLHLFTKDFEERLDISYLPVSMKELEDLIAQYKKLEARKTSFINQDF